MEPFKTLGADIESLWSAKNYNETHLPEISVDALKRADLPSKLTAWDVVEWAMSQSELPPQRDLNASFGDPPITVYSGARFHIDVYFWFEGTTAIHQHGFCGAFQVLMGSSIHSWYDFQTHEVINTFCEIGEMGLKVCEILEVGAIQPILAGRQYIHSLFHLEQPSATIVVRTDRSPLHLPQLSYHKPGLAIDPFFEQATVTKKLQAMSALLRAKHRDADRMIASWIETSDLQTSFMILSQVRAMLRSDQLGQMFNADAVGSRFGEMLEIVSRRYPSAAETLSYVFEHSDELDYIVKRRSVVTEPEHRFFLALLLNVDGRDRILSLITQRFAGVDPIEKILDWTFDLAQTRIFGIDHSNALGIADFGDPEMFALERLLKGKSDHEIKSECAESNHEQPAAVSDAIKKLRHAIIFRPLL